VQTIVPNVVIDPDEISRIYPEHSLNQLKWNGLAKLYPLYKEYLVEKIIIPVTIDEDSDLDRIHEIFGQKNVTVFKLIVDEDTLVKRVTAREPNEYWQIKLSDLVRRYLRNENARTFKAREIDTAELSIAEISTIINDEAQ